MQKTTLSSWSWVSKALQSIRGGSQNGLVDLTQSRNIAKMVIPQKPKRPLTPYLRYLMEKREIVQRTNPNLKPTEIVQKVSQQWRELDNASKQEYSAKFQKELVDYHKVVEKYKLSLSVEDKEAEQKMKLDKQLQKEKKEKKRRIRELGKPKKPLSGFLSFLQSKISSQSVSDYKAAASDYAKQWNAMSDAEKEPYKKKFESEMIKYEEDLKKWEAQMIRQGNEDLVRQQPAKEKTSKVKSA